MSLFRTKTEQTGLEEVIDAVQETMLTLDPFSDEFAATCTQLDKLYKMKSYQQDGNSVSLDGLLAVLGNIVGIGMILGFEHAHVVTSKALGFVLKSRV